MPNAADAPQPPTDDPAPARVRPDAASPSAAPSEPPEPGPGEIAADDVGATTLAERLGEDAEAKRR